MKLALPHRSEVFRARNVVLAMMLIFIFWVNSQAGQNIQGQKTQLDPGKIREAVKSYIIRYAPWDAKQMRIQQIKFNQAINLPQGKVQLNVTAPKHTDWLGPTAFKVNILVNGIKAKRLTVPANIEVWSDVILSAKPLGKYQPIGKDDIHIKKMNLARVPANAIVRTDVVLGRRANRNIAANCVLRTDQVEIPPIVKRGDIVQVVAESSIMRIAVKGMVQQNGGQGDRIKVINLRSKKIIYAQVINDRTVKVEF